jgi:hypothetical protein
MGSSKGKGKCILLIIERRDIAVMEKPGSVTGEISALPGIWRTNTIDVYQQ